MNIQTKYYLGSFFSHLYVNSSAFLPMPRETVAKVTILQDQYRNGSIRSLSQKQISLIVVSKNMAPNNSKHKGLFLQKKQNNGEETLIPKVQYGFLQHCYDEIWYFLLAAKYVILYVTLTNTDKHLDQQNQHSYYQIVKVDAYMKKFTLFDPYELKILNYRTNLSPTEKLIQTKEQDKQELIRYAKLSLLLALDLLQVKKTIPSVVKSDKQFTIFFTTIAHIHGLDYPYFRAHRFAFKEIPKIINNKQQNEEQIGNHYNKLFDRYEMQQITLPSEIHLIQTQTIVKYNFFFLKHLNHILKKFIRFIKKSQEQVLKALREEYEIFCYRAILNQEYETCMSQISHFIVDTKIHNDFCEFLNMFRNLSKLSFMTYPSFHKKDFIVIPTVKDIVDVISTSTAFRKSIEELEIEIQKYKSHQDVISLVPSLKQEQLILTETRIEKIQKAVQQYKENTTNSEEINDFLKFNSHVQLLMHKTPQTMKCVLKPHQSQALTWMLHRENQISPLYDDQYNQQQQPRKLSSLWEQIQLPNNEHLYINSFTGKMTTEFQNVKPTKGGILADEMGLGKTIMALALIHETLQVCKTTLIVVPKSVINQWEQEIQTHSYKNTLSCYKYYSIADRKININILEYQIILTTYAVLASDYATWLADQGQSDLLNNGHEMDVSEVGQDMQSQDYGQIFSQHQQKSHQSDNESDFQLESRKKSKSSKPRSKTIGIQQKKTTKGVRKGKALKKKCNNLFNYEYSRVILDEAHNIKSRNTLQTKAAMSLKADFRWCLTGTPMQNKHDDLFCLLQFLQVETFGDYFWWNTYINKEENEDDQQYILGQILSPILLRRTKNEETIQDLIKTNEEVIWVDLDEYERKLYQRFFAGTQSLFNIFLKKEDNSLYIHIFQIINKLRMCCDHPQLALKDFNCQNTPLDTIFKKIDLFLTPNQVSKPLITENYKNELIDKVKNGELQDCTICTAEFVTQYDISVCGHVFCHNCFQEAVQKQGKCPQCRQQLSIKDLMTIEPNDEQNNQFMAGVKEHESTKIHAILAEVLKVKEKREKCLIFTQWVEMIQLLQKVLEDQNISCGIITGKMTAERRTKVIDNFKLLKHQTVLILSLRASATGLNLTMANHVFLVDPWWNPSIEDQAIGRADRIGQSSQVFVKRFLCRDTIEARISQLHNKKRQLVQRAISNDKKKQMDLDDMKFLLQS